MNIGIDVDGVLTDMEREMLDYGTKMCVEKGMPIEIDVIEYYETDTFHWNEEQANNFWNRYLVPYVVESKARKYSKEIIKKLRNEGNKIYIITARDESGMPADHYGEMQQLTKEWLAKIEIEYDKKKISSTFPLQETNSVTITFGQMLGYQAEVAPVNLRDINIIQDGKLTREWKLWKHNDNLCYD